MFMEWISHHGIKGQKWGEMHGPPYPLKPAAHNKVINRSTEAKGQLHKKGLSDTAKRNLKIGAAIIGTALVAYGAYKLSTNMKSDVYISDNVRAFAEKTGFPLKKKECTIEEDLAKCNPKYDPNVNDKYHHNCFFASMDYCLRRMGLDVSVSDYFDGEVFLKASLQDYVKHIGGNVKRMNFKKDGNGESVKKQIIKSIEELTKNDDVGVCGLIGVEWDTNTKDGHCFSWEKTMKGIIFVDPQSGQGESKTDSFFKILARGLNTSTEVTAVKMNSVEFKTNSEVTKRFVPSSK